MSKGHYILLGELALILLLLFLCIRGCDKTSAILQANEELAKERLTLLDSLTEFKNEAFLNDKAYRDSTDFLNGQLELRDNKLLATSLDLDAAHKRIEKLLKERIHIVASDSSTTIVPNEFISQCTTCFDELDSTNKLVTRFIKEINEKDSFETAITVGHLKRQNQLEFERDQAIKAAEGFNELAAEAIKKSKPQRVIYLTLNIIGQKQTVINGVGAGLLYQDKRRRLFGVSLYGTSQGAIGTGTLALPLSFSAR